ncbi:uncharacterized protein LOC135398650 [Ornithodoros turicata]|uniref:uncharacterized protein LOC135398650 n=1 Tax=Ornithodoros turicata TaxID=34597 RepID=UPI0031399D41
MRSYMILLPIIIMLASSHGLQLNSSSPTHSTLLHYAFKSNEVCDYETFQSQSGLCESTFKLNMPHNHGDQSFICSIISKYKLCMSLVIRMTRCPNREYVRRALEPVQDYMKVNNINCVKHANVSLHKEPPVGSRAKLDLCTRDKAWDTQFQCAKKFQMKIKKVEEEKEVESHQICRTLSRYYSCLNPVLHSEACEEDTELMSHMEYFPKVLSQRYRDMCIAELKLTALNVAKRLEGFQADQVCMEEMATKEFFACGLLFNEIVSQNAQRDKICMAYFNFQACTKNIENTLSCGVSSDFNAHAYHVVNVLLHSYESYCQGFITPSPFQPTGGPPINPPQPSGGCQEDKYLEKYMECGISYVYNIRDAVYGPNPQFATQACEVIRNYDVCLANAETESGCQMNLLAIANQLVFVRDQLKRAPNANCGPIKRSGILNFRFAQPFCDVREYLGKFFSCGTVFIRMSGSTNEQDEKCRYYADFKHCKDLTTRCGPSDQSMISAVDFFTASLMEGFDVCVNYTRSMTCERILLIHNFLSCGYKYYQTKNEFSDLYKNNVPRICRLVNDFKNCSEHTVFGNDCQQLQAQGFMGNLLNIRDHVITLFTTIQCPPDRLRRAYFGLERQTYCNQFKAVKKVILCGVTFHKMLHTIDKNGSLVENNTSICPLVKEMKYCLYSATHDSGCSDAMLLNTEISVLKKHLFKDYEDVCNGIPSADDGEFRQYRQACELKEFTQQWDVCDGNMEEGIIAGGFKNNTRLAKVTHITNRARKRLCADLIHYRKCLNDSADRHHCSPLVPEIKDMGNTLFDRLGVLYCSRGYSSYAEHSVKTLVLLISTILLMLSSLSFGT